jgi:MtN3 and saliva related transmembrane protein
MELIEILGIYKNSIPIIYTNSMVLVFSLIMLYFKFRYGRNPVVAAEKAETLV